MEQSIKFVGLAEAAMAIGIPYQSAHRLLLIGALRGEKRSGRWFVRSEDVATLVDKRKGAESTVSDEDE
jgi:hypothetical protein